MVEGGRTDRSMLGCLRVAIFLFGLPALASFWFAWSISCCDVLCPALKPRCVPLAPVQGCQGCVPCVMAGAAVVRFSFVCILFCRGGGGAESPLRAPFPPPLSPLSDAGRFGPPALLRSSLAPPPRRLPHYGLPRPGRSNSARSMSHLLAPLPPPADCPPPRGSSSWTACCSLAVLLLRRPPGPRHPPPWRCSVA